MRLLQLRSGTWIRPKVVTARLGGLERLAPRSLVTFLVLLPILGWLIDRRLVKQSGNFLGADGSESFGAAVYGVMGGLGRVVAFGDEHQEFDHGKNAE